MHRPRFHVAWFAVVPAIIALLLTGCGSASAANASATPACPIATNFKSVTGVIATIGNNSATVTTTAGPVATVLFTATTRVSKTVAVDPTTLASGTTVQVIVPKGSTTGSVLTAQTILVQPAGQTPFGGGKRGGNGTGGRTFNPSCRTRATPVTGQNTFRGVRGTITALNPSAKQITVTDLKGNSYVFAMDSSTNVATQAKGSVSDLAVGDMISATGQQTSTGLQAINVQDLKSPGK